MNRFFSFQSISTFAALTAALAGATSAHADHGPGTSGGGAATQSGETLKPRKFSIEFRTDYTEFESLSQTEIEAKAASAGGFDLLDRSFLSAVGVSYGVVENFQIGLTLGYYNAVNAREAEFEPGTGDTEIVTFNPDGLTDLWLSGKYRFYRLTEDIEKFPQVSAFAEANLRHLFKSEEDGTRDPNTGGTVLFLTPGFRVGFTTNVAFTVSLPLPVAQDLNGEQLETSFKVNGALTFTF